MMASFRWLLALAVFAGASHADPAPSPTKKDFNGRWTVTEIVGYADIGGGIPLAKTLLGRVMTISDEGVSFGSYQCEPKHGFNLRRVDTAPYLKENAGARPEEVGLPPQVYLIDSEDCNPIFWVNQEQIEFDETGVFVRAQRVH